MTKLGTPDADAPVESAFLRTIVGRSREHPDALFCEVWAGSNRRQFTWGDLGRRAESFAAAYSAAGAGAGDVIFIVLRHSSDLYSSFLGAMLIGAVPSFLPFPNAKQDPGLFWSSLLAVFERTGARLLVTYEELAAELGKRTDAGMHIIVANEVPTRDGPPIVSLPSDDAVALLQHSSGTTGLKKGVMLTYRAIRLQIRAYAAALNLEHEGSKVASWLPLYHDMGLLACFLTPMFLGIPIISLDAFEWTTRPGMLLEAIEASRSTHVWLPNFAFAHLARATPSARRFDLGSLRAIIGCSEPNKPATFDAFVRRFEGDGVRQEQLQTCYAMAETVFAISQSTHGLVPRRLAATLTGGVVNVGDGPSAQEFLSNGRPIDGMEVRVLREGRFVDEGVVGEICVSAPFMFSGYFKDPATTDAAFVDGCFKTGDLGFIDDGEVYIVGRIKELIIANGRNFFAHDIEAIANGVDGVKKGRCAAFGVHLPTIGSEQIIIVAERSDDSPNSHEVEGAIAQAMYRHLGVAAGDVRLVDPGWLIKTTSGKVSRAENALKYIRTFKPEAQVAMSDEAPNP